MKMAPFFAALALAATPALAQKSVSITDVKIDAAALDGVEVEFIARVMPFGPMVMLTDPAIDFDSSGIAANVDSLPREHRAFIVEKCSLGCTFVVTGVVSDGLMGPEVALTNVRNR